MMFVDHDHHRDDAPSFASDFANTNSHSDGHSDGHSDDAMDDAEFFLHMKELIASHATTPDDGDVPILGRALRGSNRALQGDDDRGLAPDVLDGQVCQDLQVIDACRSTGVGNRYNRRFAPFTGSCNGDFLSGFPIYKSKAGFLYMYPLDKYPDNWSLVQYRGLVRWRIESFHTESDKTTCRREFSNIHRVDFAADGQPYKFFPTISCFDRTGSDTDGFKSSTINIRCNDAVVGQGVPTDPPVPIPVSDDGGGGGGGGGMSGGAVFAIVALLLAIIGGAIYYYWKHKKREGKRASFLPSNMTMPSFAKGGNSTYPPQGKYSDGRDDDNDNDFDDEQPAAPPESWRQQQDFKKQLPDEGPNVVSDDADSDSTDSDNGIQVKQRKPTAGDTGGDDTATSDSRTASQNNLPDDNSSIGSNFSNTSPLKEQHSAATATTMTLSPTSYAANKPTSNKPDMQRTLSQKIQDQRSKLRSRNSGATAPVRPPSPKPAFIDTHKMRLPRRMSMDPPALRGVIPKRPVGPPPKKHIIQVSSDDDDGEDDAIPSGIRDMVDHLDGMLNSFDADDFSTLDKDDKAKKNGSTSGSVATSPRSTSKHSGTARSTELSPSASGRSRSPVKSPSPRSPSPETPVKRRPRSVSRNRLPRMLVSPLPESPDSKSVDDDISNIPPAFRQAFDRSPQSRTSRSLSPVRKVKKEGQQRRRPQPNKDANGKKAKSVSTTARALHDGRRDRQKDRTRSLSPNYDLPYRKYQQRPRTTSTRSKSSSNDRQRPRNKSLSKGSNHSLASSSTHSKKKKQKSSLGSSSTHSQRKKQRSSLGSSSTHSQRKKQKSSLGSSSTHSQRKKQRSSLGSSSTHSQRKKQKSSLGSSSTHSQRKKQKSVSSTPKPSDREVAVQPDGSVVVTQRIKRSDGSTAKQRITYSNKRVAAKHGVHVD